MSEPIKPSEMLAFAEALDGSRGMLDAWLECHDEAEVRAYIQQHVKQAEAAEVERLRADAERYQWLRDQGHKGGGNFYFRATGEVSRDGLDAAIDAALKETK